ncbi:MAG: NUDIX domain-containing protein [Gemmatimonadaceae bacterium]
MTEIRVGVVDVYVLCQTKPEWQLLVLRRGPGTRCTGAWEGVHGRMEDGESPEQAAMRELEEETGLHASRLYNVGCSPFYLHKAGVVQMAVAFAAVVTSPAAAALGPEHDAFEWLPYEQGIQRIVWPRSRHALRDIRDLLAGGDAGPVEDVVRVL